MQSGRGISGRYAIFLFIILIVSLGGLMGFVASISNGGGMFADLLGVTMGLVIASVMLVAVLGPDFRLRHARS